MGSTAVRLALMALWSLLAACSTAASPPVDLRIENVMLVDPERGTARRATVSIDQGVIVAVERPTAVATPPARVEIAGEGLHAVPGLWDAHVHLAETSADPRVLRQLVAHGILGIRDAGGRLDLIRRWRDEAPAGTAPAIVAAGPTLNGPGDDSYHLLVDDRAAAMAAVERLAARGVRWIKVHRHIRPDLLPLIVAEAHARGLRVFGHIPLGMSPLGACEAGMDGIEHVGSILESIVSVEQGGATALPAAVAELDSAAIQAFVDCLVRNDVSVTPTLAVYRALAGTDAEAQALADRLVAALQPFVLRLHRAGVRLLVGSDAPLDGTVAWGRAVHEELRIWEEAGITPPALLRMATVDSAAYLAGRPAAIVPGAPADLLLLSRNPLETAAHLGSIAWVVREGVAHRP